MEIAGKDRDVSIIKRILDLNSSTLIFKIMKVLLENDMLLIKRKLQDRDKMEFESTATQQLIAKTNRLVQENIQYCNTTGLSGGNVDYGFTPAFLDYNTGKIYHSCFSNGEPAAVHLYDGLPDEVVTKRNEDNKVIAVVDSIISGFIFNDEFLTRDQAIEILGDI